MLGDGKEVLTSVAWLVGSRAARNPAARAVSKGCQISPERRSQSCSGGLHDSSGHAQSCSITYTTDLAAWYTTGARAPKP
jgi:hypothetical protein